MWKWIIAVVFLAGCQSQPQKPANWIYGKAEGFPYASKRTETHPDLSFHLIQQKDCTYLAMVAGDRHNKPENVDLDMIEASTRVDSNPIQKWPMQRYMPAGETPILIAQTDFRLVKQLRTGQTLRIKAEDAIFRVDLAGAEKALASLECDAGYFK